MLRSIPGITVTPCDCTFGFVFRMTEEQKQEAARYYQSRFETAVTEAVENNYDLLILDEILASCNYGMVNEQSVTEFLKNRPENLEVVLTGAGPIRSTAGAGRLCVGDLHAEAPIPEGHPGRRGIEF